MHTVAQTPKPATTATLNVALWVLGAVFLGQFAAVAWAMFGSGKEARFASLAPAVDLHREIGEAGSPGAEIPGEFVADGGSDGGTAVIPAPSDSPGVPAVPDLPALPDLPDPPAAVPPDPGGSPGSIPRELGGTGNPAEPGSSIGLSPERLSPESAASGGSDRPFYIVPASARIRNPEVLGTVQAAVKMREDGDTQGALESLRKADSMRPENPRILHEIATTYFHMGLRDKAFAFWKRVLAMGESGAGDYYALADIHLGETANEVVGDPIQPTFGVIRVGDAVATRDTTARDGERIFLRVPIHSLPGSPIQPGQVAAYIYFYDLVGGTRIEQTTLDTVITQNWTSPPIDWADAAVPETLDVTYFQPGAVPSAAGGPTSQRRYYGYVIRLFYENTLQDVVANPRTLTDFNAGDKDSNPQLDDALFRGGR